jgi:putative ABC transport system substrate-binding protein
MVGNPNEPRDTVLIATLERNLEARGWTTGRNLSIDVLWAGGEAARMTENASRLIASKPDVIVAQGTANLLAVGKATRTIPIVFVEVTDPVSTGLVKSIPRPGGNVTGFTNIEPSIVGKWLELLKQVAPRVTRVGMVFHPKITPNGGRTFTIPFEALAPSFGIEPIPISFESDDELVRSMDEFVRFGGNGLVAATGTFVRRGAILSNTLRHHLPSVFPYREFAIDGGLISYGVDITDLYRRAATHVHRVLSGEDIQNLPVENPVKFEMLINNKSARALGLSVPETLLATADEVIE